MSECGRRKRISIAILLILTALLLLNVTSDGKYLKYSSLNISSIINWTYSDLSGTSSQESLFENTESIFLQTMVKRQNDINHTCTMRKLRQSTNKREFYHLRSQNFIWCPVYKAASTSWIKNIFRLAGVGSQKQEMLEDRYPQQPDRQARFIAPFPSAGDLAQAQLDQNYTRLLVVRHPFQRLVSAFRDKLERCHSFQGNVCDLPKDWYFNKYGKSIVKRFRKNYLTKFGPASLSDSNNRGAPYPAKRTPHMPTWWEFVQWVISFRSPHSFDPHWRPAYVFCTPCSFNYNYILKFENIAEEQRQLANIIHMGDRIEQKWENRNDGGLDKSELTRTYFELLSDEDIDKLYHIYKTDFDMFGYSFQMRDKKYNV